MRLSSNSFLGLFYYIETVNSKQKYKKVGNCMKKFSIIVVLLFLVIFSFILNEPISSLDELWNYSFSKNISDGLLPYKDFNLVQTPLLFFFTAVFLKFIFNGLIVTRILGAVLAVAILIMIYLILNKLLKNKYINIFILLNICLINIPFYTLDYNFLVLLFALIILNYELKSKNEDLLKLNIKKDFLMGIIAGLAIITKQSTGLLVAVAYVGYKWLAIRKKEDFILAFKISLSRGLGVLVPIIIFLTYLFITNSFGDFLSFCVFGISEFSNSISYLDLLTLGQYHISVKILAIMVLLVIVYSFIYLIKNFRFENLENKNILKLFVFGIASFIVVYPISDDIHFLIGSVILIILSIYIVATHLDLEKEKVNENFKKLVIYLNYIIFTMLIVLMCFNYYRYITNNERTHNLNHYNGIIINGNLMKEINFINEYIEEEKLQNNNAYIVNGDASLYDIPADRYNKYFGLLLKGNLGKNGIENVINKIEELDDNSIFLTLQDRYSLNWQVPKEVIDYIKTNYNLVGKISVFDIYSKNFDI